MAALDFKAWTPGRPWMLCCGGKPGVGRTLLCSLAVVHFKNLFKNQNVPILCIYLNYKERNAQTLDNLVGSLFNSCCNTLVPSFGSAEAKRLFRGAENESHATLDESYKAFLAEIQHFGR